MFSKTIISLYGGIGVLQSVGIGLINCHNLLRINKEDRRSLNASTSEHIIDDTVNLLVLPLFLGTVTVLKSGLYGICWPLSQYCIYNDIKTTGHFKQHFCPGYNISPVLQRRYDIAQFEGKLYLPSC